MMAFRILRTRALLGFCLALLASLTMADLAFALLYGISKGLGSSLGGFEGGVVILQGGAKSVHTSRVPLSIAESLRRIPGVEAQAVTLSPTTLYGRPLTVRGVMDMGEYAGGMVEGEAPKGSGPWILLGEEASRSLGLRVGSIIALGSPSTPRTVLLRVSGIYRLGDMRDYEAAVPLGVGAELSGLPWGMASAIRVEGMAREELEKLVKTQYSLTIAHETMRGYITILDPLNVQVATLSAEKPGPKTIQLPFGYYTIIYRDSYISANLTSLMLMGDTSINLSQPGNLQRLRVEAGEDQRPILRGGDGKLIPGVWTEGSWLFEAPIGLYTLEVGGREHLIPLMGETTFNPKAIGGELGRAEIRVQWQDGSEVKDYLISIWRPDGTLVASSRSPGTHTFIELPPGEYEAEVSKPPYLARARFKIPGDGVNIVLPAVSNPGRITPSLYQQLRALSPIEASSATITSLLGVTTTSLTAVTALLTILSAISVITIHRGLMRSAEDNIEVLRALGAGRRQLLRMVWAKILGLDLAFGLASANLASLIQRQLLPVSILGYGIQPSPFQTTIYSMILATASWLISTRHRGEEWEG